MAPKTVKELSDHIELQFGKSQSKFDSLEDAIKISTENSEKLNKSLVESIQNLHSRFEGISVAFTAKIDDQSDQLSDKISASSVSIKEDIAKIKDVVIKNLVEDNRKLRSRVSHLETRILLNERRANETDQHARKIYFELSGIPSTVKQENLKTTLVTIFTNSGLTASKDDIEVTHRLYSKQEPKPVIVKARRDFIDKLYANKKSILVAGQKENLNFGVSNRIYLNEHLSPAFKSLRYNCKLLKNGSIIDEFWIANSKLKVKKDGEVRNIAHETDLFKIAPDFNFTFSTDLYTSLENNDMEMMDDLDGW